MQQIGLMDTDEWIGDHMTDIRQEETILASLAEVWAVWDDFGNIADWHPGLARSAVLKNSPSTGRGARRRCDFVDNKHFILEEIVEYEPEKRIAIHIYDGNIPVQSSKVTFSLTPAGPDKTRLTAEVEFKLKGGILGAAIKPLARRQLGKDIANLLSAGKKYVEANAI